MKLTERLPEGIKKIFSPSMIVFFITLCFYALLFSRNTPTDVQLHVDFALKMSRGEGFIGNFLFFLSVIVLSCRTTSFKIAMIAAIFILSASVAMKYEYTKRMIGDLTAAGEEVGFLKNKYTVLILAFMLICCSVIYVPGFTNYFIVGQFAPNVWHNSTTIFLMPFALLLFYRSYKLYNHFSAKACLFVCLLILINALIKPSFLLCFLVVYPVFCFERYLFSKAFWQTLIPVFFTALVIVLQYLVTYYYQDQFNMPDAGGIKISPFNVWHKLSDNCLVSFLVSALYPLVFLGIYFKKALKETLYRYALYLFLISVLILILVSETGAREFHGNFIWQAIVCNYILFVITLICHIRFIKSQQRIGTKDKLIFGILLLHFLCGLLYLLKFLLLRDYH